MKFGILSGVQGFGVDLADIPTPWNAEAYDPGFVDNVLAAILNHEFGPLNF